MTELVLKLRYAVYDRPFSVSLGLVAFLAGLALLVLPQSVIPSSTVFDAVVPGVAEWVWPLFYTVAGALILRGVICRHAGIEAAGMILYSFSVTFILYVVVAALGVLSVFITFSVQAAIALGATLRAIDLLRRP